MQDQPEQNGSLSLMIFKNVAERRMGDGAQHTPPAVAGQAERCQQQARFILHPSSFILLSADTETARRVGPRHGRPAILEVDADAMAKAGYIFYLSANGVWLVDEVPPGFLQRI
jgi:hypothetical protein